MGKQLKYKVKNKLMEGKEYNITDALPDLHLRKLDCWGH